MILFAVVILLLFNNLSSINGECGYKSCPRVKENMINVHLVCHSHDDVGWLKTPQDYFDENVNEIIKSVLDALEKDVTRKYIQVESYFFYKYMDNNPQDVNRIQSLITNGQLEITGGGWSMNDEAASHYQSIIDQMSYGLRKLNSSFGECGRPRIGWQIDPFGHSKEMASLFALMGYDGIIFPRMDYEDKSSRISQQKLEEIWSGNKDLGQTGDIFLSILKNHYSEPDGFNFEYNSDYINDDPNDPFFNADIKTADFFSIVQDTSSAYRTNQVLIPMGDDFYYHEAENWFSNLDALIRYSNKLQKEQGSNINIMYSTPACYIQAVNNENISWTEYSDDFFPYASDSNSFWTGYFTSRPAFKYFERHSNNLLQVAQQLQVLSNSSNDNIDKLQSQMGVVQHHDSITGTEKQDVDYNYRSILNEAFESVEKGVQDNLIGIFGGNVQFENCNLLNISQCDVTENYEKVLFVIYNPLSRLVTHYVRLPVQNYSYEILDSNGKSLDVDVVPIADGILNLFGRNSTATHEIVFTAKDIPPLGYHSYFIQRNQNENSEIKYQSSDDPFSISGEFVSVNFVDNRLNSIAFNNQSIDTIQDFETYNSNYHLPSGAYVSRPSQTSTPIVNYPLPTQIIRGSLVEEVHQKFNDYISQVTRVYKTANHAEIDWVIGPLPDNEPNEVITKFKTNLKTNGTFSTDANGRQILKRNRIYGSDLFKSIMGNYYPIAAKISLEDEVQRFSVLNDRSQGGSSLNDGDLELMLHRRLVLDDGFGVGEALNERSYGHGLQIRGQHQLLGGTLTNNSFPFQERELVLKNLLRPWYFLAPASNSNWEALKEQHCLTYSGLTKPLPDNIHLLTLEKINDFTILLRLEHILASDDDPILSKSVTIDISTMFASIKVKAICETTLGANQWISDMKRLNWRKTSNEEKNMETKFFEWNYSDFEVELQPMQIRTFMLQVE